MRTQGFTLIELLIALSLLGILSILSWRGTESLIRNEKHLAAKIAHWQKLSRTVDRLQLSLSQPATRRTIRHGKTESIITGIPKPSTADDRQGIGDALMLIRGPQGDDDDRRLAWRLRRGTLELLLWNELDGPAAEDPAAALAAPQPPGARVYPLLDEVRGFTLRYLDSAKHWQTHWPVESNSAMPRAVQMTLQFADGNIVTRTFALP